MGPVSASMPIDVSRQRAYEFVADLANRPAFMGPFLSGFHLQRLESSRVGAAARFRARGVWMETVVEETDPPYRLIERGKGSRLGRMPVNMAWEVTGGTAGGCEVKVVFWTEPSHPLDRLRGLRPCVQRGHRRALVASLENLRELLEGDATPQRVAVAGGDRVPGAG